MAAALPPPAMRRGAAARWWPGPCGGAGPTLGPAARSSGGPAPWTWCTAPTSWCLRHERAAEVVTVHDLTCVRFPEMCTPDVLQVPGLLRRALRRGRLGAHGVGSTSPPRWWRSSVPIPARVVAIPNGAPHPSTRTGRPDLRSLTRGRAPRRRRSLRAGARHPRAPQGPPHAGPAAFERARRLTTPPCVLVLAGPDGWGADARRGPPSRRRPRRSVHRIRRLGLGDRSPADRGALLAGAAVAGLPVALRGLRAAAA